MKTTAHLVVTVSLDWITRSELWPHTILCPASTLWKDVIFLSQFPLKAFMVGSVIHRHMESVSLGGWLIVGCWAPGMLLAFSRISFVRHNFLTGREWRHCPRSVKTLSLHSLLVFFVPHAPVLDIGQRSRFQISNLWGVCVKGQG